MERARNRYFVWFALTLSATVGLFIRPLTAGQTSPLVTCPCSLWGDAVTPSISDAGPDSSVELGLRFRADVNGAITALRFYKSAANIGPHVATLWTATGSVLAQVTFANETASGWQQVALASPVAVVAGTTYVASYHTTVGHYAFGAGAFATVGVDNAPLHAPAAPNGVFRYGSTSAFPDATGQDNYWVDVVFAPLGPDTTPPTIVASTPAQGDIGVNPVAPITITFSEALDPTTVTTSTIQLFAPGNVPVAATVTYRAGSNAATLTPSIPLLPNTLYSGLVRGGSVDPRIKDLAGNALVSDGTWVFTAGAVPGCPCSIWPTSATPTVIDTPDTGAVELGVRFRADITGAIAGIRFFKSAANTGTHVGSLWTTSGTLLASGNFVNETPSGWQQVLFSPPVPITANTTYVASYHTTMGHYSNSQAFFAANGVDTPPLHALASGVDGLNGVYAYGATSRFPTQGNTANYWVDVVFTPSTGSDTVPPSVVITAPAAGTTVTGIISVSATATDNVSVVGVQFTLDGAALGSEVMTPPYSIAWTTNTSGNGPHTLSAVARDVAGNRTQATSVSVSVTNTTSVDPAQVGQWSPPLTTPVVAVHMALLPTGLVVMWNGQDNRSTVTSFFNPATNGFSPLQNMNSEMFCAGHTLLDDGRLLVVGGNANVAGLLGIQDTNILDPVRHSWTLAAPMMYRRWYPTATGLPDGRVLVTSGGQTCESCIAEIPEVYTPSTNSWTQLTAARMNLPLYPFMFVLPDGRVLNAGGSGEVTSITRALNLASQTWTTIDTNLTDGGSAAMYQPGKVIKSGTPYDDRPTGTPASRAAWVLDMAQATPAWRPTGQMAYPRSHHNLTILPDGNVLATGGSLTTNGKAGGSPVFAAESWSPRTEQWTTLASMEVPRMYHSAALLLPDGRVLSAGGGAILGATDYLSVQIFSPSYLFKGPRPTITSAPSVVQYGTDFAVATPDGPSIASVSLIRLGVVTHAFDQNQQYMPLSFQATGGGLTIQAPVTPNLAPAGYYMLFVVNTSGVPSVASFIQLPSSAGDTQAPTAPSGLVAVGGLGTASLTWNASVDNVAVTGYNVYRRTTPGVPLTPAYLVAQTTGTGYVEVAPAGQQVYVVTARDAAGNASLPSNEASVTVLSDTTPPTVTVTAPADGSSLSGVVPLVATATDNVGVVGVQFQLDGVNIAAEQTRAPYTTTWNTASARDGQHTITAVARDGAGNRGQSQPATVFVSNVSSAPGLVAAYNFEEGAGPFVRDASGNNNTGTIAGAQWTPGGRFGGALAFNGATSWVTVPDGSTLDLTTGGTLEAWVNPTASTGWQAVIIKEREQAGLSYALYSSSDSGLPDGTVNFGGADVSVLATSPLPSNTWTHLALTYDGTTLRIFVNGSLASAQPANGLLATAGTPLRIGGDSIWGEYFSGLIDEVRIYNRPLTANEIQVDMGTPIVP